jgi:hypothetical protein
LTWSLVRRANRQLGDAEIWKTVAPGSAAGISVTSTPAQTGYQQSLTVIAYTGAAGIGATSADSAPTGAPSTSLTTTSAGSRVVGVGNDWDAAIARTVGQGQTIHNQVLALSGDTFWVQAKTQPASAAGTSVTINDVAPTMDQWNLAAVEVVPTSRGATQPPQVTITDPPTGAKVSGVVSVAAKVASQSSVSVQFKLDGQPLGAPVTAPPFMTQWDTRTAGAGTHTLTATATDANGLVGASTGVVVTVDNTAPPPAVITIDKLVSSQGRGALTATGLSTTAAGDVVVAFVAYDGPSPPTTQSATVSGAGLSWTLIKRSNTQPGVAEIWAAKATGTLSGATVTATPATGLDDVYLPGVPAGSWVFAVGNDWDNAIARTPVSGQVLQSQWLDIAAGDTYWVQSTQGPTQARSLVAIHDSAPATDRWNYAAVEIIAAPAG